MKKLIVTADDFGLSLPVNEAVDLAHQHGIYHLNLTPDQILWIRELVEQVGSMERQLDAAAKEISAMRRELAELREPLRQEGADSAVQER